MSHPTKYIMDLSREAAMRHDLNEIAREIAERGFWEASEEWRIATDTQMRIEPFQEDGRSWFRVRVACDHEFTCVCPTLPRAMQFLGIYECLIIDMFYTLGWPSWAEHGGSEP